MRLPTASEEIHDDKRCKFDIDYKKLNILNIRLPLYFYYLRSCYTWNCKTTERFHDAVPLRTWRPLVATKDIALLEVTSWMRCSWRCLPPQFRSYAVPFLLFGQNPWASEEEEENQTTIMVGPTNNRVSPKWNAEIFTDIVGTLNTLVNCLTFDHLTYLIIRWVFLCHY